MRGRPRRSRAQSSGALAIPFQLWEKGGQPRGGAPRGLSLGAYRAGVLGSALGGGRIPSFWFRYSGRVVEVQSKGLLKGRVGGGIRGRIGYWSQDSRRRLLRVLSEVEWQGLGRLVMVTLTYPGEFSTDGSVWKRDLQAFRKRWTRAFGQPVGVWKLEFQSRGAAHFHIVVGYEGEVEDLRPVVASWWFSIVGSGDEKHLKAGTEVSWFRKQERVAWYLGGYIGKRHKLRQNVKPENVTGVGRWWGYWGLRRPPGLVQRLTAAEFAAVRGALGAQRAASTRERRRRQGRRWAASVGRTVSGGGLQSARVGRHRNGSRRAGTTTDPRSRRPSRRPRCR